MAEYSDDFAAAAAKSASKFKKKDDAVLLYNTTAQADIYHYYDFITRNLYVRFESKDHSHIIPFRDIEPDTLAYMRDKLVELGGNPPPLPVSDAKRSLITKGP